MRTMEDTRSSLGFDEERKGLLSDTQDEYNEDFTSSPNSSRKGIYLSAAGLIILMLGAVFGPPLARGRHPRPVADFDNQKLRSNGTHWFKKTALIVSIDGLRCVSGSMRGVQFR